MSTDQKLNLLHQTDLLSSLTEETLRRFCNRCREVSLASNEILFREGDGENAMYLIISGEVLVYKRNKQIAALGPGQYLGEMALIEAKPRSASAKALTDSVLLEISKADFDRFLTEEPQALLSIMRTLSGRIRSDLDIITTDVQKMSILAHDMRNCLTPLGLVEGYLEDLIEEGESHSDLRKHIGAARRQLQRLMRASDDLSHLISQSLSQARKISYDYKKTRADIVELATDTVEELALHKDVAGKQVRLVSEEDVIEADFNVLDIKRVLQNLIINAGFVTVEEGTITVMLETQDAGIRVSVMDEGPGIVDDIRSFLMRDAVTTKEHGAGLGLLSCREIIEERHQGRLWYESVPGEGTMFYFAIPLRDAAAV